MSYEEIKLQKSPEVTALLDNRHILEEEVKQVIHHGETSGEKLYQPETNRFLAKLRLGEVTFYVEYSAEGNAFAVHIAYSHRSEIVGG